MCAQHGQYGLKHRATLTVHDAMCDILSNASIEISNNNVREKEQIVILISCTKTRSDACFF